MQTPGWGPAPGSPQEGKLAHGCHPTGQGGVTAAHGGVTGPTWSFPRTLRDPKGAVLPPSAPQAFLSAIPLSSVPAPDGRGRKGPSFCSSLSAENPSQRATSRGAHPARSPGDPRSSWGAFRRKPPRCGPRMAGCFLPGQVGSCPPRRWPRGSSPPLSAGPGDQPGCRQRREAGGIPGARTGRFPAARGRFSRRIPWQWLPRRLVSHAAGPQPQSPGARMGGTRGAVRRDLRGRSPHGEELGRWRRGTVWNRPHLEAHQVTCPPRTCSTRTIVTQQHERPQLTSEGT